MNFVEINYNSQGKLDTTKIEEHSKQLLIHFNNYFSELGKDEHQLERMKTIIQFEYNFTNEIERIVFSELLLDAINRINFVVGQITKLNQENVKKLLETLGRTGVNTEILKTFIEAKIDQNRELKIEIKELINKYASYLIKNSQLNIVLNINDSVCEDNFIQAESYLNGMLNEIKSKNGGCYIATMAYGDYDHPQVMILRDFRDEKLSKSAFGRWIIKTYYRYSPLLVEKLKSYHWINRAIRAILNFTIKIIK